MMKVIINLHNALEKHHTKVYVRDGVCYR